METLKGAIPVDQFEAADEQTPPPGAVPVSEFQAQEQAPPGAIPVDQFEAKEVPEGAIPINEFQSHEQAYGNPEQQTKAAIEGAARGATFGLSTGLETGLGIANKEDIEGRKEANPLVATGSEAAGALGSAFIPGVGEGWLLAKAAKTAVPIAEEMNATAKIGRLALRGMIETSGFQAGDEISNAFLGKDEDGTAIAGHIAAAGALGMLTGGVFGTGGELLKKAQDAKLGNWLDDFAIGLGSASKSPEAVETMTDLFDQSALSSRRGFNSGVKFYNETSNTIAKGIADKISEGATGAIGQTIGGVPGALIAYDIAKKYINPYAEKLASKHAPSITKKIVVPVMLRALKIGGDTGLTDALNYGTKSAKGINMINDAVDSIFKAGGQQGLNEGRKLIDREKLNQYIEDGGSEQQLNQIQGVQNTQNYAKGGKVEPAPLSATNGLARLYPEQNTALSAAKMRVPNYLNTVKPQQPSKLAFDTPYVDKIAEKSYNDALDIANQPISVLQHIKDGTLDTKHVKHLISMYPELHTFLSKKLTERITNKQLAEEKPSAKIRQGLSLFLGAPLSQEFTPIGIQAAQSTFIQQQPPQQQAPKSNRKPNKASLDKIPKDYETQEQARDSRRNKD